LRGVIGRLFGRNERFGEEFSALEVYSRGDHDRTMKIFTTIIDDPGLVPPEELVMVYYLRARIYSIWGRVDAAIDDYSKAIDLDPTYAGAYSARGNLYFEKGLHDLAKSDFDKAIKHDPDAPGAYHGRGAVGLRNDLLDQAIADFTRAIELGHQMAADTYALRANAYARKQQWNQCITDYDEALAREPRRAEWRYFRGLAQELMGAEDEALADYQKALQLDPNYDDAAKAAQRLRESR